MNWERVAWEGRVAKSQSESVFDWGEEGNERESRRRSVPKGLIRCSLCPVILHPRNLRRHDRRVHKIKDRQQLVENGILPTTKYKLKYSAWPSPGGSSFKDCFTVDIVADDSTWERQRTAADSINWIAPRIMLRHKAQGFLRRSIRCTLICYSDDSEAGEIARNIFKELISIVVLTLKIETKKPMNCSDLVIYL